MMKITLKEWAEPKYSKIPTDATLRRWARDGWIYPMPEKRGRQYFVERDAIFIGADYNKISLYVSKAA